MKVFVLVFLLISTLSAHSAPKSQAPKFNNEILVSRDGVIWSFDFLPDQRIVYTLRSGKMFVFDPKTKESTAIANVPRVAEEGQGGLLDVRVHPQFSTNKWLYFTYSEPLDGGEMTTSLARAKLEGNKLIENKKLLQTKANSKNDIHFGSRLAFSAKHLFMTIGDRNVRDDAQRLDRHNGKVLRLNHDGTPASENPFVKQKNALPEIYSYGHRNPQGLAINPVTDEVWEAEMGPRGGDEINAIKPGANYGWPVITFGKEYWGPSIGEGTKKEGMEQPLVYWVPSISPSNITFYYGSAFPEWKESLFVGTLSGQHIRRLALKSGKIVSQEEILSGNRFRNLREGPDGFLYYSTDDGKLGRLTPKN